MRPVVAILLLTALAGAGCRTNDAAVRESIRAEVDAAGPPDYVGRSADARKLWTATQDFYRARGFAPVWLHDRRPTPSMDALRGAVKDAGRDGLDSRRYDLAFLDERAGDQRKGFREAQTGQIESRLTFTYLQLASDLAAATGLEGSHPLWHMRRRTFDPLAHLTALADGKVVESLHSLRPSSQEYRALSALLAEYRSRASSGQSTTADGAPLAARIQQIEINMERWRWLPRDLPARRIVVNIPAYRLDVWEGDTVALSMRVVVGKRDTPTPIFTDNMTHLVFSPYWNVPPTIAKGETIPAVLRDPSFLDRTNMEVLDGRGQVVDPASIDPDRAGAYKFRQRPGTSNALGLVKFMFPNEFNVYLHDTPADSLFARTNRSFSHGCVRLERPEALAEYLLKSRPEWTPEKVAEAMHGGEERTVTLPESIPVYIGYWTVDVTPDGKAAFLPDVYGVDAPQAAALNARHERVEQPRLASRER
jgi:murein L,D-transpeptidase YcbB/YkuD